jgi:hypothetical protein
MRSIFVGRSSYKDPQKNYLKFVRSLWNFLQILEHWADFWDLKEFRNLNETNPADGPKAAHRSATSGPPNLPSPWPGLAAWATSSRVRWPDMSCAGHGTLAIVAAPRARGVAQCSILQWREARGSPWEAGGGGGVEMARRSSAGVATCTGMFGEGSLTTATKEIGRKRRGAGACRCHRGRENKGTESSTEWGKWRQGGGGLVLIDGRSGGPRGGGSPWRERWA